MERSRVPPGGYSDHPAERGGATHKGILQREYDRYRRGKELPEQPVREIADAEVEEIYWREYWLAGRCERMPWPVNLAHFDACVNTGLRQAAKFLQRIVGTRDDGLIVPPTLGALIVALERESPDTLAAQLTRQRIAFYRELARRAPAQRAFLRGWLTRVEALAGKILEGKREGELIAEP
jgi:lysozyme family protein